MTRDVDRRAAVAREAAEAGAAVAHEAFRTGIAVETKSSKTDVVTQADRDAQKRVVEVIAGEFPDDVVVGEEGDGSKMVPDDGPVWVVDPIDGTSNFVRDVPVWATSVAAVVDGEPVAAANVLPAIDDTYVAGADGATHNGRPASVSTRSDPHVFVVVPTGWWGFDDRDAYAAATAAVVERFGDLRRYGSAQAELSMVAGGHVEAAFSDSRMHPWDSVAGVHLVRRAGGVVTDLAGDPWRPGSRGLVASNGPRHDDVLAAARAARRA